MFRVSGLKAIVRALSNPNYGIYAAGNVVSLTGTWMQRVAVGWLAWELTGSSAWLGAIAFAEFVPSLVVGLFAGAAADRWNRLAMTKVTQLLALAQALLLFALTAAGLMTPLLLLLLTLVLGTIVAFKQPARLALVSSLVSRDDVPTAVAINSVLFNMARFIGPALAGLIILSAGVAAAFAANGLTFLLFLLALTRLRIPAAALTAAKPEGSLWQDIGDGLRHATGHPGIAPIFLLLSACCLFGRPFVELLPGFADAVFDAGAGGLALLTSTIGVGATLGGLWMAQRGSGDGLERMVLHASFGLVLAMLAFVATDSLWLAVPALALSGVTMVVLWAGSQTYVHLAVDSAYRGRILSLHGLIFRGGVALGALGMGAAAELLGLRLPVASGALVVLGATLAMRFRMARRGGPGKDPAAASPGRGHGRHGGAPVGSAEPRPKGPGPRDRQPGETARCGKPSPDFSPSGPVREDQ